ncbi:MAG: DNA-directed RNA polymerase subunit alpha [Candidatus Dojkabacteria bacterium]|nr:DNA-directed RNA polymerase subunit alpha [Candidatus Dojkabacteria bacterium]
MFAVDKFKFKVLEEKDELGKYSFGPFPKGYGITIGNAFRRILLSSIQGAAITSVSVKGAKHEYSAIPGVMDDVLNIILKLKQLSFKCHSEDPQTLVLDVKGKKVVKGSDIKLTADVELANPEIEITELTDASAKLNIEIIVEKGVGYQASDESKRKQIGVIPVDPNFSPVKRVVFDVGKARVGQQTDLDEIILTIKTNGVVSPKDVLDQATNIYNKVTSRLVAAITGVAEEDQVTGEESDGSEEKESQSSDLDIDKLNLSARLTHSLIKSGYKNLTDLEGKTMEEIMEIRGLGKKSVEELIDIMKSYKLDIKD